MNRDYNQSVTHTAAGSVANMYAEKMILATLKTAVTHRRAVAICDARTGIHVGTLLNAGLVK